nr:MAG TPA: hypothetical protein [Bacteriophage sp.]
MAYLFRQDKYTIRLSKCQIGRGNSPVFFNRKSNMRRAETSPFRT